MQKADAIEILVKKYFNNYTLSREIWQNIDSPQRLNAIFGLSEKDPTEDYQYGVSLGAYVTYLEQHVLNVFKDT